MTQPLIPETPPGYHHVIKKESYQQSKAEEFSPEDRHRRAMFEIGNTKFAKDGRTYVSRDPDGEYQSCFVSQYSKIIDRNIEPKVRGVCHELHKKNYLTYGSCQGHSDSKLRWVGLVFNTIEQKYKFINSIDKLNLDIFWYDNHIDSEERPKRTEPWYVDGLTLHIVWDQPCLENSTILDKRDCPYTDKELTKFWNLQMCRSYDHYESVVMVIGRKIQESNFIKQFWTEFRYNEDKIEEVTKSLEEKIKLIPPYDG